MSNTFKPIKIGASQLNHRLALAPMTRCRADKDHVPTDLMATFYDQRSKFPGTLLITEATVIAKQAGGQHHVPGIWSKSQIAGWKKVTDKVHANKSTLFLQLWAMGRVASKEVIEEEGYEHVGVSTVGRKDSPSPRALKTSEIKEYVQLYAQAAKNAIAAGADGVEIHGANGYLLDQSLNPIINDRTDEYGGSIENRARFTLEVVDAVIDAVGADRTAIRLSPWSEFQDMGFPISPLSQHSYLVEQLEKRAQEGKRLAYIHTVEPAEFETNFIREIWKGVLVRCGNNHDAERRAVVLNDENTIAAVGRYFLSTSDFVQRVKDNNSTFNDPDWTKLYTQGPEGYVDYPTATATA